MTWGSRLLFTLLISAQVAFAFANLSPQTITAFDRYIELSEAKINAGPQLFDTAEKSELRSGKVLIASAKTLDRGKEIDVPDGLIQDWVGRMFIPGAGIAKVKGVLQDYTNYKFIYKPDVLDSKELAHQGDQYDVYLRLRKKKIITVVLNSTYHVLYRAHDPMHLSVLSRSTRIAEVNNPGQSSERESPVGNDSGFLWRLNSYWRFEEADGGVYAECEAISLSRDVPGFLSWMIKGLLESLPKESMANTLRGTKEAVLRR